MLAIGIPRGDAVGNNVYQRWPAHRSSVSSTLVRRCIPQYSERTRPRRVNNLSDSIRLRGSQILNLGLADNHDKHVHGSVVKPRPCTRVHTRLRGKNARKRRTNPLYGMSHWKPSGKVSFAQNLPIAGIENMSWISRHSTAQDRREIKRWRKRNKKQRRRERQQTQQEQQIAEAKTRKYLTEFWWKFNLVNTYKDRMDLLKMAANPPWPRVTAKLHTKLRGKYRKLFWKLLAFDIQECVVCNERRAEEKHHIVPLSFGGINEDIGLLKICLQCHETIHPWMKS